MGVYKGFYISEKVQLYQIAYMHVGYLALLIEEINKNTYVFFRSQKGLFIDVWDENRILKERKDFIDCVKAIAFLSDLTYRKNK